MQTAFRVIPHSRLITFESALSPLSTEFSTWIFFFPSSERFFFASIFAPAHFISCSSALKNLMLLLNGCSSEEISSNNNLHGGMFVSLTRSRSTPESLRNSKVFSWKNGCKILMIKNGAKFYKYLIGLPAFCWLWWAWIFLSRRDFSRGSSFSFGADLTVSFREHPTLAALKFN